MSGFPDIYLQWSDIGPFRNIGLAPYVLYQTGDKFTPARWKFGRPTAKRITESFPLMRAIAWCRLDRMKKRLTPENANDLQFHKTMRLSERERF